MLHYPCGSRLTKKEIPSLGVTPHLQPKNICHKQVFKAHCLNTIATIPTIIKLFLVLHCGSLPLFQPLSAKDNINTEQAPHIRDRLLEPHDKLDPVALKLSIIYEDIYSVIGIVRVNYIDKEVTPALY